MHTCSACDAFFRTNEFDLLVRNTSVICCTFGAQTSQFWLLPHHNVTNGTTLTSTLTAFPVAFCLDSAHDLCCASPESSILFLAKLLSRRVVTLAIFACRVRDYWEGYKLFCYAFYSHSSQHELEFEHSKLGSCISIALCFVCWNRPVSFPVNCRRYQLHRLLMVFTLFFDIQGRLYGDATHASLLPHIMRFAPLACTFSLLWRCTASGSSRRIAAIWEHFCFVSTRHQNYSQVPWGGHFCT
jgi:hypothetical protein